MNSKRCKHKQLQSFRPLIDKSKDKFEIIAAHARRSRDFQRHIKVRRRTMWTSSGSSQRVVVRWCATLIFSRFSTQLIHNKVSDSNCQRAEFIYVNREKMNVAFALAGKLNRRICNRYQQLALLLRYEACEWFESKIKILTIKCVFSIWRVVVFF